MPGRQISSTGFHWGVQGIEPGRDVGVDEVTELGVFPPAGDVHPQGLVAGDEGESGPELTENRRQKDVDERNALARWRDGDFLGALQSWRTRGRLIEVDTIDQKVADMAATWRAETRAPDDWAALEGVVMIAGTNESVDRLNATVQGMREQQGRVHDVTEWHLAAGRVERLGLP